MLTGVEADTVQKHLIQYKLLQFEQRGRKRAKYQLSLDWLQEGIQQDNQKYKNYRSLLKYKKIYQKSIVKRKTQFLVNDDILKEFKFKRETYHDDSNNSVIVHHYLFLLRKYQKICAKINGTMEVAVAGQLWQAKFSIKRGIFQVYWGNIRRHVQKSMVQWKFLINGDRLVEFSIKRNLPR